MSSIEHGKEVIRIEAKAIAELEKKIDERFASAVEMIFSAKGRVIITGMGKSGLVARKIVATMNSTGTPAFFLHTSDAVHGDLGAVRQEDVVICISKSGETEELVELIPTFRQIGVQIISMVGQINSRLAKLSDVILDTGVEEEACPYDLAPTASTTAALVMGDALAISLLQKRNFTREDFARFHPGGILGRQLLLRVGEMMVSGSDVPIVCEHVTLSDAIVVISTKRLGATCVVNDQGILTGVITDGDLRRLLQRTTDISSLTAKQAMTRDPKTIRKDLLAAMALREMEQYSITQLIVVDEVKHPVGMLHLHDLVKAGIGRENGG
jgi:arabinose-5-phosphate isomerase